MINKGLSAQGLGLGSCVYKLKVFNGLAESFTDTVICVYVVMRGMGLKMGLGSYKQRLYWEHKRSGSRPAGPPWPNFVDGGATIAQWINSALINLSLMNLSVLILYYIVCKYREKY